MNNKQLIRILAIAFLASVTALGCSDDSEQIVDDDMDTIPDAEDNCPGVANPGQENMDGDEYGDACDVCIAKPDDNQLDSDADGVGDECDNCPNVANADQAIEACDGDGDGVVDDDDNCPTVPNPGQTEVDDDDDDDGVGNACDPRPGAQDCILRYDNFNTAASLENWKFAPEGEVYSAGQWAIENGFLRQKTLATDLPTLIYLAEVEDRSNLAVEVAYTVDELPPNDMLVPTPYAGLITHYEDRSAQGILDRGFICRQEKPVGTLTRLRVTAWPNDTSTSQDTPWFMLAGETYRLLFVQSLDAGTISLDCSAEHAGELSPSAARQEPDLGPGSVGLLVNRAAVSYDYVVVYSLDCPAN